MQLFIILTVIILEQKIEQILSFLNLVAVAQPNFCYGLQQSSPAVHIMSPSLRFSENDTLYIYTSLLQNSTCSDGTLVEFDLCYKPICSSGNVAGSGPVLYILVLLDRGMHYVVRYIHEEMEDRGFCDRGGQVPSNCCCKSITVESSEPIVLDESYALGFIVPKNTQGEYLYEIDSMSPGFISSPPPLLPAEGGVLEVVKERPQLIPNRLVRVVLEPMVTISIGFFGDI